MAVSIPTRIGRYDILGLVAHGDMGPVYRAKDTKLDRVIAIKVMIHDNDDLRERFVRESRSVARLHHPHVVTVFDDGEYDGQPFTTMEYVPGDTLADVVRKREPLDVRRKLELIEAVCAGLAFAHHEGIVHRDVRPTKVIVDERGLIRVVGFGFVEAAELIAMTRAGTVSGTFNYLSPEQISGSVVDHRSDIFSVGALLYELLCYQQTFSGSIETGLLDKVRNGRFTPLQTLCPELEPEIVRIAGHALEVDPQLRYQDIGTMLTDLQRIRRQLPASDKTVMARISASAQSAPTKEDRTSTGDEPDGGRKAQIEVLLAAADEAYSTGHFDGAIASCEQVLQLDSGDRRALELLERTAKVLDRRQADEWLTVAEAQIQRNDLSGALAIIEEAAALDPSSARVAHLRKIVDKAVQDQLRSQQPSAAAQPVAQFAAQRAESNAGALSSVDVTEKKPSTAPVLPSPSGETKPSGFTWRGYSVRTATGSWIAGAGAAAVAVLLYVVFGRSAARSIEPNTTGLSAQNPTELRPPSAVDSPSAAASPSSPVAIAPPDRVEEQLVILRKRAREQFAARQKTVLSTIEEGLTLRPDDPDVRKVLDDLLMNSRQAAIAVGASAENSPSYKVAFQDEEKASRFVRAGRVGDAVLSARLAIGLYEKAVAERINAGGPPVTASVAAAPASTLSSPPAVAAPPDAPPAEKPPAVSAAPPQPRTPPEVPTVVSTPAPPTPPAVSASPAPTVNQERQRIESVLAAYVQAYRNLDVGAVKRLYPNVNERALQATFRGMKSQTVQIQNAEIVIDGANATVTCVWSSEFQGTKGGPQRDRRNQEIGLQRTGDAWTIVYRK